MTPISAIILPDTDPLIHGSGSGSVRGSPGFIGNLNNIYAVGHDFRSEGAHTSSVSGSIRVPNKRKPTSVVVCCCFCRSKWQI